ncbi:hypothetical protein [Oscillatoria salina]|uniref:hypothetical protein n=1 Tax=Oscillatoria salina TaxID=331517 RepID=UPI001CC9BADF|nr:hypothetical protein [Oscillatoria salina]MBZ8181550.1 hypothetical protein [Oscillatoria salina IIICB1]
MEPNQGIIIDSYHFYNLAKDAYYQAKQKPKIHRQNEAAISVIFSALSLEAFINEFAAIAILEKASGGGDKFLDKLIDAIEESADRKKNTQDKFMLASKALNDKFDKGKNPYQDFADLFKLRDCLVHLKPHDRLKIEEDGTFSYLGRKFIKRLTSKNILRQDTTVESITLLIASEDVAKWACDTASAMVNAILNKIAESKFSKDNPHLELYRQMFQSLEIDEKKILEQEHQSRQTAVSKIEQLRPRLLETYGEFPDCVELLQEDRSR